MSRLKWDENGERFFETGVRRGVLYPMNDAGAYQTGVAWNGLVSVSESPEGGEANPQYADDIKYLNLYSVEEVGGTIEAFTYPDEFAECDGSASVATGVTIGQQRRKGFGLCYRTVVGNDVNSELGYKLHLVYGCMASPSEKSYETINDSPEPITFSWDYTTTPVDPNEDESTNYKPTATIVIDSTKADQDKLTALENILYGTDGQSATTSRLPLPAEVISMMS